MTVELPQSLVDNPLVSTWLTVATDGAIELRVGKVEIGQGIVTALTQIAAHELDVPPDVVRPTATNTAVAPDEGSTSGSLSIMVSGAAVRRVCAEARELFRRAAARRAQIEVAEVQLVSGVFVTGDGTRIGSYGDLAAEVDLDVLAGDATLHVELAPPASKDLARVDLPDKIMGRPRFIHDLEFAGMLHGRIVRPPRPGAHLEQAPTERGSALPGVQRVVQEGDFLAVIAAREGQATQAAEALAAGATWTGGIELPDVEHLDAWLRTADNETTTIRSDGAHHDRGTTLRASYSRPYVAHGSIGPSCGIATFDAGRMRVWSHSQAVFMVGRGIAAALDLPSEAVVVQHVEGAGSYGHNSSDDVALDAALLATHVPGRHVRVLWSRADELSWDLFGPAMVGDIVGTLDDAGQVTDLSYDVWGNGHVARAGYTPQHSMLADGLRAGVTEFAPAIDPPVDRGEGTGRNAEPYYDIARADVSAHRLLTMPLRTASLRSLGAHLNTFAIESFMDELAATAGRDPLEFRLAHLSDPRARDVLTTAAEASGWGTPTPEDHGRGLGFCRYKNQNSYCAVVADVEATESVRVTRLTIAVDVGQVVSIDGLRNQIEGGAIQATSWSLMEKVVFDRASVTSTDWESYPIIRFSQVPRVDVHLIPRPDEPSFGVGEATQGPVPAAIGNAIADALGVRVRRLPFTTDNIVAAIEAQS